MPVVLLLAAGRGDAAPVTADAGHGLRPCELASLRSGLVCDPECGPKRLPDGRPGTCVSRLMCPATTPAPTPTATDTDSTRPALPPYRHTVTSDTNQHGHTHRDSTAHDQHANEHSDPHHHSDGNTDQHTDARVRRRRPLHDPASTPTPTRFRPRCPTSSGRRSVYRQHAVREHALQWRCVRYR